MKYVLGSVGHAQSQGCVERQNQLLNQVRALCSNDIDMWPSAILTVQYAHNVAINKTTRVSPYEVMFGERARAPETVLMMDNDEVKSESERCNGSRNNTVKLRVGTQFKAKLTNTLVEICQSGKVIQKNNRRNVM